MNDLLNHADQYIEFNLCECGREKCIPDKIFSFTPKPYFLIHYVCSGAGTLEMNQKTYHLKKGSAFLIRPGQIPMYYPDKHDPWSYIWFGFSGANAEEYMLEAGLTAVNPVFNDQTGDMRRVLEELHTLYVEAGFLDLRCLARGYDIVAIMMGQYDGHFQQLPAKIRHINAAKEFIANNYQFPITIVDIASNVGVTPNYLANIFNEVLGISPKRYLIQIRIDKACLLLKTNKYRVKEVAKRVGYDNQLHFSSEFRKNKAKSPIQYMREGTL